MNFLATFRASIKTILAVKSSCAIKTKKEIFQAESIACVSFSILVCAWKVIKFALAFFCLIM